MNPPKFASCLEDLRRWASTLRRGERAIVYGSVARGTSAEESDLDLLVVAPRARHDGLADHLIRLGAQQDVRISPFLVEPEKFDGLDPQFVESVARDGLVLKGPPLDPTVGAIDLHPHYLVTLYLGHLAQRTKVQLSRELYGYRSSRQYKNKRYASRHEGFLARAGGRKLGRGTVLVPAKAWPDLEALIRKYQGKRWAFTVWAQGP